MERMNISLFFQRIESRVLLTLKKSNFDPLQLSLLEETLKNYQIKIQTNLYNTSLSTFYLIVKHYQKDFDEQTELLGCFLTLYVLSLDLFDDVQDNDLAGKIYQDVGAPIAINNALTLLFLSFKFLSEVVELEDDDKKRFKYLKVFNQLSLIAVKGQHKDLMGIKSTQTPEDVLKMQKEKASSIAMIAQCAAIFSNCNDEDIQRYKNVAEQMVLIYQIVDDVRDIFGKKISPDIQTNKFTYPIANFFVNADHDKIKKFNELKEHLPDSMKDIRALLYESGTLSKSAETVENLRRNIYKDLISMNAVSPSIRTMLYLIDELANKIYKTPFLEESKLIFQPQGGWYETVNKSLDSFFYNMKEFMPPKKPTILPWHLPEWMYDFNRNIIFYSDIENQPEEILPVHSKITGISDLEYIKNGIKLQSDFFMSHELFHYWRKKSGKLTQDFWYEEWVANNLAISYIKTFLPDLLDKIENFLHEILSSKHIQLSTKGNEILSLFSNVDYQPDSNVSNYGVSLEEIGYIQVVMISSLISNHYPLKQAVEKFL